MEKKINFFLVFFCGCLFDVVVVVIGICWEFCSYEG